LIIVETLLEFNNCGREITSHMYVTKSVKAFVTGTAVEKSNRKNFFKQITDKYSYQFLKEHNSKVQNHFDSIKMEPNTKQRKSIDNFH
jgi:ABC-type dipeptide/oligopeptide/nickel transport system ATPase component